ncbi:hypothetical protein GCM10017600_47410 [Streptosporangium carneum]|uniref:Uncharacterized protein n=2 Tax=Streptosporangium carneum TaxID=47481 RepID=A0A9W6ME95_9ACTN|nr:hypothetical protein GCM10017600_47410 [Streptosporangium carneum]
MEKIAEWHREFQVWHYSVSHSTLLLRSVRVDGFTTRIDVLFAGVELMRIKPVYSRIAVLRASEEEKRARLLGESEAVLGKHLFLIDGDNDYVVAGGFAWHEDEGDHHTPSRFGPLRGTE